MKKKLENIEKQICRYPKYLDKINPILVKKYKRYLDWIMLVYNYEKETAKNFVNFNIYKKKELLNSFENIKKEEIDAKEFLEKQDIDNDRNKKQIEEILNWSYDYELSTTIPTKTSVTKIKQMQQKTLGVNIESLI